MSPSMSVALFLGGSLSRKSGKRDPVVGTLCARATSDHSEAMALLRKWEPSSFLEHTVAHGWPLMTVQQ